MNVSSIASSVNGNDIDQVIHFLTSKAERGEIPPDTARQRCTAIRQILAPLAADEPRDVDWIDQHLDALGERWATLNPSMKGDTARTYVSRARASIEDWKAWRKNASGWKFAKRTPPSKAVKPEKPVGVAQSSPEAAAAARVPTEGGFVGAATAKLRSVPLDDEREFSFALPAGGITVTEARRIAYTLVTLARDFDPSSPGDPFALTPRN